jgi:transcriptional antiterminator NusG
MIMEESTNPENLVPGDKAEEIPAETPQVPEASVQPGEPDVVPVVPVVVPEPAADKPKVAGDRRWFVVQTFTGQEDKAKSALEQTVKDENLQAKVFQILVPLEETIEIKGGKRVEKVRKMFPGYVFLEMILDEQTWYLIRQTNGVARFIGNKVSPTPVSDKEMQRVLKQLGKEEQLEVNFEKGEAVRVISGAFRGYTGSVDEINAEKGKLKVLINIFGRDTPVEVNFEHAQKMN